MEKCCFLLSLVLVGQTDEFPHKSIVECCDALMNAVHHCSMGNPVAIASDPIDRVASHIEEEDKDSFATAQGHFVVGSPQRKVILHLR